MPARLLICFALGAVLGTLLDGIHVYGDVLTYPDPAFGRWAWFVPLEFGLLGAAAAALLPLIESTSAGSPEMGRSSGRRLGERPLIDWSPGRRLGELLLFFALYATTALADGHAAVALAVVLLLLAAARLALSPEIGDLPYVVVAAVLGPAAEAVLVAGGAFCYSHPDVIGIPYWLPGLWANGGYLIRRLLAPIVMPGVPRHQAAAARTAADRS